MVAGMWDRGCLPHGEHGSGTERQCLGTGYSLQEYNPQGLTFSLNFMSKVFYPLQGHNIVNSSLG